MMFTTKTIRNASLGVVLAGFTLMTGGCVSSVGVSVTPASLKVEGVVQIQKGLTTDINYDNYNSNSNVPAQKED